jgi:hypothetical protein
MEENANDPNLDELGKMVTFMVNNQSVEDFLGYSPAEMQNILYNPFEADSMVRLRDDIPDEVLDQIPFLRITEYLIDKIKEAGEIKLTKAGNLPVKIVFGVYGKYFTEDLAKYPFYKPTKEQDIASVHVVRIVLELSRLVKKRNNKLSLTKAGEKLAQHRRSLLNEILRTYAMRYNMGYNDGYDAPNYGNTGLAFILIALHKFGDKPRTSTFYAEKYHTAFPAILASYNDYFPGPEKCFNLRLVTYFFSFFNFIDKKNKPMWNENYIFTKSDIYDQVIHISPSNAGGEMN